MKAKKFLSVILSLAMLCACATASYALPSSGGEDAHIKVVRADNIKVGYAELKTAFEYASSGETIELLGDITVNQTATFDASNGKNITLKGNGHKITLNLTADNTTGDGLRFENMTSDTVINIEDVKIDGKARIGINFRGAGNANLTNVTATGEYYGKWETNNKEYTWGAVNWGNNCGGTVTDCDIVSGFANGDYNYPLTLKGSTKFGTLLANAIQDDVDGGVKIKAEADGDKKPEIGKLVIGKYNDKESMVMIDKDVWQYVKHTEFEGGDTLAAEVDGVKYATLKDAFAAVKTSNSTVKLLEDITLTESVLMDNAAAMTGFTFDGGNHTITLNMDNEKVGLQFGKSAYMVDVNIKDLTIEGQAKYAVWLYGGKTANFEKVKVEGTYNDTYGAVVWHGTCGGTLKNCDIVSGFVNGQGAYPLKLESSNIRKLLANNSDAAETKTKVYVDATSSIEELTTGNEQTNMIDEDAWAYIKSAKSWDGNPFISEVDGVKYTKLEDACEAANASGSTVKACMGAENIDEVFGKIFYINNMKVENGNYRIGLFATVKNLDFDSVGFDITVGDSNYEQKTTKVYSSINVTGSANTTKNYAPRDFGGEYIFGQFVQLPEAYKEAKPKFTPFAIFNGTKVSGSQYTVDSIYNK